MIRAQGLKKVWEDGNEVFSDINFEIEEGEIYALVGRSGAGKSTLLRCINGLTSYNEGSLQVAGKEIREMNSQEIREFRKKIGMIFQQFSLLERKSVYENVALPMKCWKYPKDQTDAKVRELLELVGLSEKMRDKPRTLSGGQKQRVAIARALTMNPEILLCDEATSALDPKTTNSILDLLTEINQKLGITIVVVTHQMEVVRRSCQRMSILEKGRIVEQGSVREVFEKNPPALKRLLGKEDDRLPQTGRNLRFSYYMDTMTDGHLFPDLSAKLGGNFPVLQGDVQSYNGRSLAVFTVNLTDGQFQTATEYLDEKHVHWEECGGEAQ